MLVLSGPAGDRSDDEARALVRAGLQRVALVAREAGSHSDSSLSTPASATTRGSSALADALALLDEAGLDDVGIMADTYNLAGESSAALVGIVERLSGLHVAELPPTGDASGTRVLPGAGDGSSLDAVRALREAGWDGTLDVEIFSTPDDFWALPADEAARRAYAAADRLASQTVP